jgi:hypothetical protein
VEKNDGKNVVKFDVYAKQHPKKNNNKDTSPILLVQVLTKVMWRRMLSQAKT